MEQQGEVVYIKVFNLEKDVVFEGKVSTDVEPHKLLYLGCFRERHMNLMINNATKDRVRSFAGLRNNSELVALTGDCMEMFSGVLYVGADDHVLRKSESVPLCDCVMISVWKILLAECDKLFKSETLELLEISRTVAHIPADIGKMKKLKKLRFYGLDELSIAEEIGELSGLKELRIEYCDNMSLPKQLKSLKSIHFMGFEDMDLHAEYTVVFKCESLEELEVSGGILRQIPADVGNMKMLKKLRFYGLKELKSISDVIGELSSLTDLQLEYCDLESLPKRLKDLKSLKSIYLLGMKHLELHEDDVVVFSKLKQLTIFWCDKAFSPAFAQAFWQMIKSTTNLSSLVLNGHLQEQHRQMISEALEENGSIVDGGTKSNYQEFFNRNKDNHLKALQCVLHLMSIRRWRNALNGVPKEMVKLIAMMLWNTRCDVQVWSVK